MHATGNEDRTPRRAHRTRGTYAHLSCCAHVTRHQRTRVGSRTCGLFLFQALLNSHSISPMFHGTLLDPHLSPHFSSFFLHFLAPTPNPMSTPSLLYPSTSPNPCATLEGLRFSAKYKKENDEYTRDLCGNCVLQTEQGKAKVPRKALTAYQQQRRTKGGDQSSCAWYHFQSGTQYSKVKKSANKLLAKAADAIVRREAIAVDGEEKEEVDMLQLNESIP